MCTCIHIFPTHTLSAKKTADILKTGTGPYTSPIPPNSAFQIRNRLLSRMGTKVGGRVAHEMYLQLTIYGLGPHVTVSSLMQMPEHMAPFNPLTVSYGAHAGLLK